MTNIMAQKSLPVVFCTSQFEVTPQSRQWKPVSSALKYRNGCWKGNRRVFLTLIPTSPFLLSWIGPAEEYASASGSDESRDNIYSVVKEEVRKVLSKSKAPGVLRLAFHDAGTFDVDSNSGGINGSIVYELDRPENIGLKKSVKILKRAKEEIDAVQPVSWADLIAIAGAEAVAICGGPLISIPMGRLDSGVPDSEGRLPQESLTADALKKSFLTKGFSTRELVALSGAHTIGGKGFGSPIVFDNSYYKILLEKPWASADGMKSMIGLPSDHALVEDDECLRWINLYAKDLTTFFDDFSDAYAKLVNSTANWKRL